MLAFLLYRKVKFNGALGAHSIQDAAMGLAPVRHRALIEAMVPQAFWQLWFPPTASAV